MLEHAKKNDLINEVKALIAEKWSKTDAKLLNQWIEYYYRDTPEDDLNRRSAQALYGAAVSHWQFAQERSAGQDKVRFYNPDIEEHGWESTHSIVEIVTDDKPFLVDSLSIALNNLGLTLHLVVHPVIPIARDAKGKAKSLSANKNQHDAVIRFEVDRRSDEASASNAISALKQVLDDVRKAVTDWQAMRSAMQDCRDELANSLPKPLNTPLNQENLAFLDWLINNHFTFLGYKCYDLSHQKDQLFLNADSNSGLGLLQVSQATDATLLPICKEELEQEESALIITKTSRRSTVHRHHYLDYIGIKRYDKNGKVIGEHRFIGLYTSAAYSRNPSEIPLLRQKLDYAAKQTTFARSSHAGKALTHILETFPRDELYQIDRDTLFDTAIGILHLQERQRVKLFTRTDRYCRFITCLVYAPRDRYNTQIRKRMEAILQQTFEAKDIEFSIELSNAVLARIYFVVHLKEHVIPEFDRDELQRQITETTRSWSDRLYDALIDLYGEEKGNEYFREYENAFPASYREDINHLGAAHDVKRLEALSDDDPLGLNLYRPLEHHTAPLRFRVFQKNATVELSEALPLLENMGVKVIDERPYEIVTAGEIVYWVHDFGLNYAQADRLNTDQVKSNFQQGFDAVWKGHAENDRFNTLILACGLDWREISVLRAYSKYLKQTGTSYSFRYIADTLEQNPQITHLLIKLFHQRHTPNAKHSKLYTITVEAIEESLNNVPSLDQDKIIRRILAAILATQRTNYYQNDANGEPKDYISLKLKPADIPDMPQPTPAFEIFVCSPETEGVHLRGGTVARGGLRWSDRLEDYRTEVLGLVKSQMVKNAVIVPVGAKGGFIAKRLEKSMNRDEMMDVVKDSYRTFIRSLLDITDNIVQGELVPPSNVVRHDDDDPYLVVAADKGTATFSDIANGISEEYGFWLGDAFASGGSVGYDHKAMGITAKGGWESVKRHFREAGIDCQHEEFTVVGIGDMSGDVFGNGMLLSQKTKVLAAFDHRHIFIDPAPDAAKSYAERERLFALPRSSWEDYNAKLISKGGGVYPRSLKSITLSDAAKAAFNIKDNALSPNDLINALLKSPVDLIWNGGIGTYVKASSESHADVGDKTNDVLRVNGKELRCKIFGEGGNLGMTQLGRIEFAGKGGRVNTDFIDNSAGVDCSDHEVNIKILLNQVVANGDMTTKQRNTLLANMTAEVSELVLRHNYAQTQALTLEQAEAVHNIDAHAGLIRDLEREGILNRELEYLPSEDEIQERRLEKKGLTRPELCVLLAYAKIDAFNKLLQSDLPEDNYFHNVVVRYFPTPLREKFSEVITVHSLAREIIATTVCNQMINRLGVSNLYFLRQLTGAHTADVIRAFNATRDIFRLPEIWQQIDELDNKVSAHIQSEMLLVSNKLATRGALWLLRNRKQPMNMSQVVDQFGEQVYQFNQKIDGLIQGESKTALTNRSKRLVKEGVKAKLASQVASMQHAYASLDLVSLAEDSGIALDTLGKIYYEAKNSLDCGWILRQIRNLETNTNWQMRSAIGLEDDWYKQQRDLTLAIAQQAQKRQKAKQAVDQWQAHNELAICRFKRIIAELKNAGSLDFSMLSVAVQEMRHLAQIGL